MTNGLSRLVLLTLVLLPVAGPADDLADRFRFSGRQCILREADCGIVNGRLTVGIPFKDAAGIDGLWAPPYVSSDFHVSVRLAGEQVDAEHYQWWPFRVDRQATVGGLRLTTSTALVPGKRAGLLLIELENTTRRPCRVSMELPVHATLDRTETWEFARPKSHSRTTARIDGAALLLEQGDLAIALQGGPDGVRWDLATAVGKADVALEPLGKAAWCLAFAVGPRSDALAECRAVIAEPRAALCQSVAAHRRAVGKLSDRLPRLESPHAELVRFYDRSLVHLLMNRWDVPEFALRPYYGTGSVRGGCICSYLWNFGEVWEILPLDDPQAVREHIRQYFKTDLTAHFAFNPMTGRAFGPWYMVNQEKIVGLVYYYVKATGDVAFLDEATAARTTLEHVLANALYGDDPARPVALIDYGPSNSHLELRRGYPYNHVMPDLNGRRYATYRMAAELAAAAGKPAPHLLRRAECLKSLLKRQMWNPVTRWFDFQNARGEKDTRYTIQIFKLFGAGVLDAEEEAGLLGHLNPREFLSEFGLHSLAKTDVAYDQVDIDNGGGGSCTSFPLQIAERLYKARRPAHAADLLRRILWWADHMPYWGDSLVANQIDYRKDTPLQCTIDGAAGAQCIIFGMFGVDPQIDGRILISPQPPAFAPRLSLKGLRLRGAVLDIGVDGDLFQVACGDQVIRAKVGQAVVLQAGRLQVVSATSGVK